MNLRQLTFHEVSAMPAYLLVLERSVVQVLCQIRQRRTFHRSIRVELQSALSVIHAEPANIRVVAAFLRTNVGIVLVAYLVLIHAQELAVLTVAVVLNGASSIVGQFVILPGHLQLHAVTEHGRHLGSLSNIQFLLHDDLSFLGQRVGHQELSLHVRHVELCDNDIVAYRTAGELHLGLFPHGKALLHPGTIVVVGRSAPELGRQALTVHEHRLAVNVKIVYPARAFAYRHRGTASGQLDVAYCLFLLECGSQFFTIHFTLFTYLRERIGLRHKLLAGHHLPLVDERLRLAAAELKVHQNLIVRMMRLDMCQHLLQLLVGNEFLLLRSYAADINGAAVLLHLPHQLHVVQRLEEVLVIHLDASILQSLVRNPNALVVVAHLVGMRIQPAVRSYDAVAVEVVVAGRIASIVASVGEDFLSRQLALVAQSLVHKVPDVSALELGVLADELPVLLESADGVTHGVGILTLYERPRVVALRVTLAVLVVHVHRAEDVGLSPMSCLLVLHGAHLVISLDPVVALLKVRTVAGLVAQAPDNDAGVVFQRHDVCLVTLQVHQLVVLTLGQRSLAVAHAVTLDVGLGRHVEPVLVAQVVPAGVVRIVTCPHGVDVELLHNPDVLNHALHAHHVAAVGVQLVAVHTFY